MPTSLVKFSNQQMAGGTNGHASDRYFWGRADVDGLPYRGQAAPVLTDAEYEESTVESGTFKNRTFDLSLPDDAKAYAEVMDRITSGWYRLMPDPQGQNPKKTFTKVKFKDPQTGEPRVRVLVQVYVEWVERYMVDGRLGAANGSR